MLSILEKQLVDLKKQHRLKDLIDEMKKTIMFADVCIIFIHSINPYGMSWLRRVNENNVDLNRNFLEKHEGEPEGYKLIDKFVNAPGLPKKFDPTFYIQGIQLLVRYGFTNIKQWFAQGQYTRPKSLQYGGDKLQEGPSLILEWLKKNLQKTKEIFAIDLHTGLGPSGFDTILIPEDISDEKYKLIKSLFNSHVTSLDPAKGVGYKITGDIHAGFVTEFPSINWICITQEFGTFKPMSVLKSLRSENKWTNFNDEKDIVNVRKHWSRSDLLHVFNPEDPIWQEKLISRGNIVFNGELKNIGGRRADFVKVDFVFRKNWSGETKTLTTFIRGGYHTFDSGITTDATLLPGATGAFELYVPHDFGSFIGYSYVVDWEEYE